MLVLLIKYFKGITMIARRQTSIKVDPVAWDNAKEIFKEYNMTVSDAINLFLNRVRLERGLPFDVKIPNDKTLQAMRDVSTGENYEDVTLEALKKTCK